VSRILIALLAVTMLAGCGTPSMTSLQTSEAASADAQSLKTTIVGTVAKSQLAGKTVLSMSLEAKRPLLKNVVQDSTFYKFMDKETRQWRGISSGSRLYLSKDGGIHISGGPTNTELWYKVGTYQVSQLRVGFPVNFVLDGEHTFKVSNGFFHLDIFHPYKSRTGSEIAWSTEVPKLVTVD
jgi:hypothetical protein